MLKRFFDVVFATIGLLLLAVPLALIAIWIKVTDPGPVFFIQERVGQFGRPFNLFKFRSMLHDPEGTRRLVTAGGDSYITKPGRLIRKYKIDELPQLFNVVLGDMSLVGPRPEVQRYIDCYSAEDREVVLSVKPGITDFAAIEYRDEESELAEQKDPERYYIDVILPKKIALYRRYVAQRSLGVDFRLILATLAQIVR